MYKSETSKCRERLSKFCKGNGLDLGYGGDPIITGAITLDINENCLLVGNRPLNLKGNAANLYWFKDSVLDYVYASHLLEDFSNTKEVLEEWLRVLKVGGNLVIFSPVELVYKKHCERTRQPYNVNHKINDFGPSYLFKILNEINKTEVVHYKGLIDDYSFELVLKKIKE